MIEELIGWAVKVRRNDGTSFYAIERAAPFTSRRRADALLFAKDLRAHRMDAVTVRVRISIEPFSPARRGE